MDTKKFLNIIFDDYSENAFQTCKSNLYKFFDFEFLSIRNTRRIDCKEELFRLVKWNWKKGETISEYFGIAVKYYIDNIFRYETGSRADKYRKRAVSIANDLINKKTDDIKSLESLAVIYFSLLREHLKNQNAVISEIDLAVDLTDLDVIEEWRLSKIYGPESKEEIYRGQQKIGQIKVPLPKMRQILLPQSNRRKNKVYRLSCLLLCRLLDKSGLFTQSPEVIIDER